MGLALLAAWPTQSRPVSSKTITQDKKLSDEEQGRTKMENVEKWTFRVADASWMWENDLQRVGYRWHFSLAVTRLHVHHFKNIANCPRDLLRAIGRVLTWWRQFPAEFFRIVFNVLLFTWLVYIDCNTGCGQQTSWKHNRMGQFNGDKTTV